MEKVKTFLVIAIIIVIIILIAWAVILGISEKKETGPGKEEPAIAEEIYGLSGEIKEIKDRTLLVEANILLADPQKESIKRVVKVAITDETKIFKLKFPEEILGGNTEPILPEKTEISPGDLEVGDKIDIETVNNISENIKNRTEITASTINIIE